jgi:hypothetical protein
VFHQSGVTESFAAPIIACRKTAVFHSNGRLCAVMRWYRSDGPQGAAAPHMALVRLRMQQIARLLAEALLAPLSDTADVPLHLVNIAGGPALDSINALIMLARARATLIHRPIAIHVFDAQQDGPTFGARTLLCMGARSNSSTTPTTGTTPRRSRVWSPASPRVAPSSRPRRRAACSSTAPTT